MSWLDKAKNALFGGEGDAPVAPLQAPAGPVGPGGSADSAVAAQLAAQIAELSSDGLSADHLDRTAHMFDYGYLDSLSAVSLIGFIADRYELEISESDLIGALDCIDALARHIERHRGAS